MTPTRRLRIGGVTLAPGEAKAVPLPLATRAGAPDAAATRAVPAWVVVGTKPGPRVSIVAAPRGTESAAAVAARALARTLDPAALSGAVVIVPVLRAGGRFAPRRRPGAAWRFPGEPGGGPRERDAFTLFSELVVGAGAVLVLGAPRGGRRAALTAEGDLDDPRVLRLAAACGAQAARKLPRAKAPRGQSAKSAGSGGTLVASARGARVVALELHAADSPADETRAARLLEVAATAALTSLGLLAATEGAGRAATPAMGKMVRVRAPVGGLVEGALATGAVVRAGATLGHVTPTLPGKALALTAPVDALVLEAPARAAARKGTPLFVLAPLAPGAVRRRTRTTPEGLRAPISNEPPKLRAGWVEHVTLPDLAIPRLKAKIDTGARTSALHVSAVRTVDMAGGPHRRPILEITVPGGGRGRKPHLVRAAVRGYAVVRDTSGRTERRPVIETALRLGPLKKRIAVTLTNRGDMVYPMLIGRTALGAGVVVDPSRRYLLG